MFTNSLPQPDAITWKDKKTLFKRQFQKKARQNLIQTQRYLYFSHILDWRVSIDAFKSKIDSTYNYFTILNTIFQISDSIQWRLYIGHMKLLISVFQNKICAKNASSLQEIKNIADYEIKLQRLLLLKDLNLHKHLMVLVKMFLAFNGRFSFLNQVKFSQILVEGALYSNVQAIRQTLWVLAQIQISTVTFVRILKHEIFMLFIDKDDICLLGLLTIIANFLSRSLPNNEVVQQFLNSKLFQKVFQLGLKSTKIEVINEAILIFNNGLCFSHIARTSLLKQKKLLNLIMSYNCQQKFKCQQILGVLKLSNF